MFTLSTFESMKFATKDANVSPHADAFFEVAALRAEAAGLAEEKASASSRRHDGRSANFGKMLLVFGCVGSDLCSIFQNLPDCLAEMFKIWQNFADFATFTNFLLNFHKNC